MWEITRIYFFVPNLHKVWKIFDYKSYDGKIIMKILVLKVGV